MEMFLVCFRQMERKGDINAMDETIIWCTAFENLIAGIKSVWLEMRMKWYYSYRDKYVNNVDPNSQHFSHK